jgi:hypothetical protein
VRHVPGKRITLELRMGATVSDHCGGRSWWANLHFTRINIKLTIHHKKIEEMLEMLEVLQESRFSGHH